MKINKILNVQVTLIEIFEKPTIEELAIAIEGGERKYL